MPKFFLYYLLICCCCIVACNNKTSTIISADNSEQPKENSSNSEDKKKLLGTWFAINFPLEGKAYAPTQFYKVTFGEQNIGIQLDVNSCGVDYKLTKTNTLKITDGLVCTEACCDNKESGSLSNLFHGELTYAFSNDLLKLKTASGEIVLTKSVELIQGTTWRAVSYADRKEGNHIKFSSPYVVSFSKKTIELQLNANSCSNSCSYDDKNLTIEVPSTAMGCTRKCCDNEDALLLMSSLKGKITYKKDNQNLILTTNNKEIIFVPWVDSSKD